MLITKQASVEGML